MRCLLFFPFNQTAKPQKQFGFTLLELLIVIALLAIVAGVVITSYGGVQDQGRADAVKFEMAEIRKALLQFRRDSGSRDFPGQGVYDCDDDPNADTNTINSRINLNLPNNVASLSSAQKVNWCINNANFWMLFQNPLDDNDWDPDTRRGWNGPYLQNKSVLVSYSSIDNIPSVLSPYQSPYLLFNLDASTASIISMGENDTSGAITGCSSNDEDDSVVCLLQ